MILTDEELEDIKFRQRDQLVDLEVLRAVESAVLEKLRQQKPIEFWLCKSCGYYYNGPVTSCDCMASDAPEMVHLYAAPVPATTPKE